MRLSRLDLLRYGRFTDTTFEFPKATHDFHVIYGPNEAGKTTALSAIEDLLFGIPTQSPYNFLHTYESMRIGALLENDGSKLEFQRRKSRRATILDANGSELPEEKHLLIPFLGGINREFFDRMFSLSHSRLAEGGQAILDAEDDVGQMLFAAGTGLADLKNRMTLMEEEATGLWTPRRNKQRRYYQASDRLKAAESNRRQHELTAKTWKATEKAHNDATTKLEETRRDHGLISKELRKLSRIRRVYGLLQRQRELTGAITSLGSVTELPEDAAEQLNQVKRQDAETTAVLRSIEPDLRTDKQLLESTVFDERLVQRTDDIRRLDEQYITARKGSEDLPKRQSELQITLKSMASLTEEIGWKFDHPTDIVERIPTKTNVEIVRNLVIRHSELAEKVRSTKTELEESQRQLKNKTQTLAGLGSATDVSSLTAVLTTVRESSDIASRIRTLNSQADAILADTRNKLATMSLPLELSDGLDALDLPTRDTVAKYREDFRDCAKRQGETKYRLDELTNELERDRSTIAHRVQNEGAVEPDAVIESRRERDALWELIYSHFIQGSEIAAEELETYVASVDSLPEAYIEAVRNVDRLSDRRFDQAEASAELAALARRIANHEVRITQTKSLEAELAIEGERLTNSWKSLWSEVPLQGGLNEPDSMLTWLDTFADVLTLQKRERELRRTIEDETKEEEEATTALRNALKDAGEVVDDLGGGNLRVLIQRADEYLREQKTRVERIAEISEDVRIAGLELSRRESELSEAKDELSAWRKEWRGATAAIDLHEDETPDAIAAKIKVIEDLRDFATEATNIQERRINTIERDITSFKKTATELIKSLAPDLVGDDFEESTLELKLRHEEALKLHQQHEALTETVRKKQSRIKELKETQKLEWAKIQPLMEVADVTSVSELTSAIDQSDRLRRLRSDLEESLKALVDLGDGLPLKVLEEECSDVEPDTIVAREQQAEVEFAAATKQLEDDIAAQIEAKRELDSLRVNAGDGALNAAVDREEALASMNSIAEQYIRVWTASSLMRWAIDRYRRDHQVPLLNRASEIFHVLTLGSFKSLEVHFDEQDKMHLMGVRPNGEVVAVPGLSSGTEDQLFLSLRMAAVQDYLDRAISLPFVGDDLFINFDVERATAGIRALHQLSKKTQILFFTHHQHLVTLAQQALGDDVHILSLDAAN